MACKIAVMENEGGAVGMDNIDIWWLIIRFYVSLLDVIHRNVSRQGLAWRVSWICWTPV